MPLMEYICALGPMLSVCTASLMISKYGYTGLVKPLKTYKSPAAWSGVPTHTIIWRSSTLKLQKMPTK